MRDGQPFLFIGCDARVSASLFFTLLIFDLLRGPALQTAKSMIQLREAMLEVDEEAVMTAQFLQEVRVLRPIDQIEVPCVDGGQEFHTPTRVFTVFVEASTGFRVEAALKENNEWPAE